MSRLILLLVPPFALLVWRPEWTSAAALLGAMLLLGYLDRRTAKTDWNGSMSVDIDQANHAINVLSARVDAVAARDGIEPLKNIVSETRARLKTVEEAQERHAQTLAKAVLKEGKALL